MTEQEWLSSTNPQAMLVRLHGLNRVSDRKWRLFAVASSRANFTRLLQGSSRWQTIEVVLTTALEHIERHAEGQIDYETMLGALQLLRKTSPDLLEKSCVFPEWLNRAALRSPYEAACSMGWPITKKSHSDLLRCLFGNPFHPASFDPAWLQSDDGNVRRLAQAINDERSFHRLPVLADRLENAGCTSDDILSHCRSVGPHARGCWVLDSLLEPR